MLRYQQVLVELLSQDNNQPDPSSFANFNDVELGDLFYSAAFLVTAMQFLKEEHWVQNGNNANPDSFKDFVIEIFKTELSPIPFLQTFFESSSVKESKGIGKTAEQIEDLTIQLIKSRSLESQKVFAAHVLQRMSKLFALEIEMQKKKKAKGLHLGISFYRTFDRLDEIFNLNYASENGVDGMMNAIQNSERVYAGSGVAVQSGYSTVLTALENLDLKSGYTVVDLGSGYGRVGLVIGLLRPDITCIGYEYVQHRVEIANLASQNLGLQDRVRYFTCDLSDRSFQIPDAEVYYMYDPFSDETYMYVLSQLVDISRRKKITIVTKGNARAKLMEVAQREGWPPPREFDESNLCLFGSKILRN